MTRASLPILDQLQVASPCDMSWADMTGDDRRRFCGGCRKHVYNLTVMAPDELVALIERTEGKFCGRLYQRGDRTVMTDDCPVGLAQVLKRAKRRTARILVAAVTLGLSLWAGAFGGAGAPPIVMGKMAVPMTPVEPPPEVLMGEIEALAPPAEDHAGVGRPTRP